MEGRFGGGEVEIFPFLGLFSVSLFTPHTIGHGGAAAAVLERR